MLKVIILNNYLYLQSEITESGIDFLQHLALDVCIYILSFLDDPIDVVRVGAVSRFWHQFGKLSSFSVSIVNLYVQPS